MTKTVIRTCLVACALAALCATSPAAACNWYCNVFDECVFSVTTTNLYCHIEGGACIEDQASGCFDVPDPGPALRGQRLLDQLFLSPDDPAGAAPLCLAAAAR
jgi:hypothetical protein